MSRVAVIGRCVAELVAAHLIAKAGHEVTVIGAAAAVDDALAPGWVPPTSLNAIST